MRTLTLCCVLVSAFFLFSLNTSIATAQEPEMEEVVQEEELEDIHWLWGQVISVENNTIKVKYIDYDTDSEKEIAVEAEDNTLFENAASLADIKPEDTISIDYVIDADGKNVAKVVSIEKLEDLEGF